MEARQTSSGLRVAALCAVRSVRTAGSRGAKGVEMAIESATLEVVGRVAVKRLEVLAEKDAAYWGDDPSTGGTSLVAAVGGSAVLEDAWVDEIKQSPVGAPASDTRVAAAPRPLTGIVLRRVVVVPGPRGPPPPAARGRLQPAPRLHPRGAAGDARGARHRRRPAARRRRGGGARGRRRVRLRGGRAAPRRVRRRRRHARRDRRAAGRVVRGVARAPAAFGGRAAPGRALGLWHEVDGVEAYPGA